MDDMGFRDVDKGYWENTYPLTHYEIAPKNDLVRRWIESSLDGSDGSCFEIGCLPGQYLAIFGELGFQLNGIDILPQVESDLPRWLAQSGYRIGEFICGDFLIFEPLEASFDVVCSFGLIEHFKDWGKLIEKQASMVRQDGYLIISTPNFRGSIQKRLHLLLDKDNYARHNIESMQPDLWAQIVRNLDFEIIFCGYFGRFHFWTANSNSSFFNRSFARLVRFLGGLLKVMPEGNRHYAPFCGLVARKLTMK